MKQLYINTLPTDSGEKYLEVYQGDILEFPEKIDILITSAFKNSYAPIPGTIFRALHKAGISAQLLALRPEIDLRNLCHVWLSAEISNNSTPVQRIGCLEMCYDRAPGHSLRIGDMLDSIKALFFMLDIASQYHIPVETVVLPLLGGGCQHIEGSLVLIPIFNECISFLSRNEHIKKICFVELDPYKAELIASSLTRFYQSHPQTFSLPQKTNNSQQTPLVFISYASADKNIADNLCAKLENKGFPVWYAPRNVTGPYAACIANAISSCTHFIVILSKNSFQSEHVLNEVDLAFQKLPAKVKFKPLRIDDAMFTPSFNYYLSRQHWMDAKDPPLEERLNEFVAHFAD